MFTPCIILSCFPLGGTCGLLRTTRLWWKWWDVSPMVIFIYMCVTLIGWISRPLHSLQCLSPMALFPTSPPHWSLSLLAHVTWPSPTWNSTASHRSLLCYSEFCVFRYVGQWVWDAVHLPTICQCERKIKHPSELFLIELNSTEAWGWYPQI